MLDPDTSFILRNTIMQIGIELKVSYYYNRVYKMTFLDFKRKQYTYRKKRMFTIRYTLSRNSKV
jgi:ribosomal protein L19